MGFSNTEHDAPFPHDPTPRARPGLRAGAAAVTKRSTSVETRPRIVQGPGSLEQVGALAAELGAEKALIVSDPGIVAAGHPNRALLSLMRAGVEVVLFEGVEENPTTEHVEAGASFAREQGVDLLIGLGGGSSIDCARGLNFLLTNGGKMADYWGVGKATQPMLPLIAIPTTAGTGSEAQSFAIIADAVTHQKMACGDPKAAAAVAVLDPELTLTQPRRVTAVTGIDAASHALETWVTRKRTAASAKLSREAWALIRDNLSVVLENPDDVEARGAMLLGAHLAGAAIEASMLGAAHSCANPLTAHYDVTHGAAVGLLLPAVIRFNAPAVGELYDELGGAEALAERIEGFLEQAGLARRLTDYGVDETAIPTLAAEAAKQWTAQFNPRPAGAAEMEEIYRCVL